MFENILRILQKHQIEDVKLSEQSSMKIFKNGQHIQNQNNNSFRITILKKYIQYDVVQQFKLEIRNSFPDTYFRFDHQMSQNELKYKLEQSYQNNIALKQFKTIQTIFQPTFFEKQFGKAEIFSLKADGKRSWGTQYQQKIQLKLFISPSDLQYVTKIKQIIIDIQGVSLDNKIVQTQEIPFGEYCVECYNQFGNDFYYYCKWESMPNQFRCIQCIEKKNGNEYLYKNNAILKKGKGVQTVITSRLGRNIQPEYTPTDNQHSFSCNGDCSGYPQFNTPRHICLNCRQDPNHNRSDFVDLCSVCMKKYINGNQKTIQRLKKDGHHVGHIFLRIRYQLEGYYKY